MRTTLVLRDDAYEVARKIAFDRKQSLGETISDLILDRPTRRPATIKVSEDGLPIVSLGVPLTVESVRQFLEEDDDF